jgi:hypothetical protein
MFLTKLSRLAAVGVGLVGLITGLAGLVSSGISLAAALRNIPAESGPAGATDHFHPAFYGMLAVTSACCLAVVICSIDLLCLRLRWSRILSVVLLFEILYYLVTPFLWLMPSGGSSWAAAFGGAYGGLMIQLYVLFPCWAPFVLLWATQNWAD